jgi:hypothetical protein
MYHRALKAQSPLDWAWTCWSLLRRKFVLVLGSLHLTAMAALGLWMWSSPYRYEATQARHLNLTTDMIPLPCTNTTLFGSSIPLTSGALNGTSLVFYSIFLAPCLNLIVPAVFFLLLFMRYGDSSADSTIPSKQKASSDNHTARRKSPNTSSLFVNGVFVITKAVIRFMRSVKAVWPIFTGLLMLLMINIVFIVDIESTIHRAIQYQKAKDELQWTFGQTLSLLLLILPIRDVFDYIKESREAEYAQECTKRLEAAVKGRNIDLLREAAKRADNVHAYIDGRHAFSYLD